jgi:signal transduction histidine kinase
MADRWQLLRALHDLIKPGAKSEAVGRVAGLLGVETVIIFLPDPEAGQLLAAPGFPQTLPGGKYWQEFLIECTRQGDVRVTLPWPTLESLMPTRGVTSADGSVIAFIGGKLAGTDVDEMLLFLPLLTAALKGERIQSQQLAASSFAGDLAKQTAMLAQRLDESRRAVQKELQARTSTEQVLRARELELNAIVQALEQARGQLQSHADEMEKRVAERTAKLSETVGELEAFSYSIAHDMRAPLRAMQGYASYVMEECGSKLDGEVLSALQKISSSAIRLDRLIQDVLNYSRLVRAEFKLMPVNLDCLARNVIDSYDEWRAPKAEVILEGELPTVLGNEAFLTQCISNLVGNAVKFVKPGIVPRVVISSEMQGDNVLLRFRDNGIGFQERESQRIFKIFERLHTRQEYDGTGIGLAIVRKAVERMGGKVMVQSEPGRGSVFTLQLKGYTDDAPHTAR